MIRKLQTLDLEFSEYCHELLMDGMEPVDFLRIKNQYRFLWDACRRRCADLCVERGLLGMARTIMKNEDDSIDEQWLKSYAIKSEQENGGENLNV